MPRAGAWSSPRRAIVRGGIAVLALGVGFLACAKGPRPRFLVSAPAPPPPNRPIETIWPGFTSSDTCRACHPHEYATWHASFHRTMTQVAGPATIVSPWEGELEIDGKTYVLQRRGEEFWVELEDPAWKDAAPAPRVWKEVVLATGSHHFQAYWLPSGTDRRLVFAPFCYRIDEQRWMAVGSAFVVPPNEKAAVAKAPWNKSCLRCHTTKFRPRIVDQTGADTRVVEFGIACEACHGPAREHVLANRNPLRRYALHFGEDSDETIVDPTELHSRRASMACGQCHGLTELQREKEIDEWNTKGYKFKPGQDLLAQRELLTEGDEYFWSDGMVRVAGREYNGLLRSPCYQHDDEPRILSCFSCHEMHPDPLDPRPIEEWRDDQLKPEMRRNAACTQCHVEYAQDARLAEHTHHASDSAGSACYDCHMPHTSWGLLKAIRSHEVSSPSVAESLTTGRPNACNLCHLDRTLAWTAEHLREWFGVETPGLEADERSIAASILWLLSGDAGQRALVASHMGWAPAQRASGSDWMAPFLGQLLEDPYDAVRFSAWKTLRALEGYEALAYEFSASAEERAAKHAEVLEIWRRRSTAPGARALDALLLKAPGELAAQDFERLLSDRDDKRVFLVE